MYVLKHCLRLIALLCLCLRVNAQSSCNLVLSGVVEDRDNGEDLSFAVVKLLSPEMIHQANDRGEFRFENLCSGTYQILVQHFGCRDTVFSIVLAKSKRVVLQLPHSTHNLEEIDVMDKRVQMTSTQAADQLSAEELREGKGKSLGELLKNVSGVTALNSGGTISKPMVHGMQGYRLLILNNGIRQEGQQWGNEHAPEIDPFIAKQLTVVKGVNAIRYGSDAIAGVVLVEPADLPDTAAVTGELNLVGLSNGQSGAVSAALEGSFEKLKNFSWRVQGTLKKGGAIKTPDYYLSNTGMEERNFSVATGYHRKNWGLDFYYSQFNTEVGIFRGSHIGNLTDLNNALRLGKPVDSLSAFSYDIDRPRQEVSHELIKGQFHFHFSPKWRLRVQYAWQYNARKEFDQRRLTAAERQTGVIAPDMDLRVTSQTGDVVIEHDNIRSFRGMYGISYMNQANVYAGRFFIPNYLNNTFGVFMTERFVRRFFELEAGIRFDRKELQSYFYEGAVWKGHPREFANVSYNAGLILKPNKQLNFFVNGGTAWRAPAPNELYSNGIHQGAAVIERGNADFMSEICYNLSATALWQREKLKVELGVYTNQFQNFIYLSPSGEVELTIRGAFPVFEYRQNDVSINGLDLRTEYALHKNISVLVKGMLVRAWNRSLNDYLIYMPADRADLNLRYKFPSHKIFDNAYVQVNNQFVAKQWRSPSNIDFAPPPPAYYLLGVEAGADLKIKKQTVLLTFSATNLLNARYREYLDRFRYYCDAMGVSYNLKLTVPLTIYDKK